MRPDIVPGAIFPDYELSDHVKRRSNKSEARRQIAGESRGTDGKPTKSRHPTAF